MSFRSWFQVLSPVLAAALAAAACRDASSPIAPNMVGPTEPTLAKGAPRASGTGIGVIGLNAQRIAQPAEYHGGTLMFSTSHVYLIWYGSWSGSTTPPIVTDLVSSLGGSAYLDAIRRYTNAGGVPMPNAVQYGGSIYDSYSQGASLANYDVGFIVGNAIIGGQLPPDPDGIYVVLTSSDVNETSGFGTQYCGFHSTTSVNGATTKVVFVGHADRVPTKCKPQAVGPNGDTASDAMANVLVNELFDTTVDPEFGGWYDKFGFEPADKCAWDFGATYRAANGARANVKLGKRDFLLQQNWVNQGPGHCALANAAGFSPTRAP